MSTWPSKVKLPKSRELLLRLDPENEEQWVLQDAPWPPLDMHSPLPLLVIKVCAVAIHRDELVLADKKHADKGFCRNPGYEFSGYVQAATVPLGGLVAYQALFASGLLREPGLADWGRIDWPLGWNQWVSLLITGAHTPAGIWAIQLAKLAGVGRIAVTCNAESADLVRSLGASDVYLWTESGSLKEWAGDRYSAVLDLMGGVTLKRAWRLVTEQGKIVSVADDVDEAKPGAVSPDVQVCKFVLFNCPKHLDIIASLVERGSLRPVCDPEDVFDIEKADQALEKLVDHPRGQVVLKLDTGFPIHEIETLDTHSKEWGFEDFCVSQMQEASEKDADEEKFEFVRWLKTVGSNQPDLAELTATELMPPPHLSQARSRPWVQIISFNGQIPDIQRGGVTQD
ncbi:hypothetical protein C8A01DRAFT_14533 [Parachaetomium inaequale]|uniref:Alcohol dehydrogenase-like C-terminal domain-containing protein n=1 Tax=Parachaetomium inaequale TaxID=2588326 RepID=A0AAN6PJI7_9PEZI|nr:hypothetical protein C8A01DRAFT_14533 [Parachaetomium inaequale]